MKKKFRSDDEKRELIASHDARDPALSSGDWHKQRGLDPARVSGWRKQLGKGKRHYSDRTPEEKTELIRSFQNRGEQSANAWKREHNIMGSQIYSWIKALQGKPPIHLQESREIVQKSNGADAELKMLRVDVHRLKYLVAELSLDRAALIEKLGRI